MTAVPQNNNVLCRVSVPRRERTCLNGIEFDRENFPIYEVVSDASGHFNVGDSVVCETDGMELRVDDKDYRLFKFENVAAKILDV